MTDLIILDGGFGIQTRKSTLKMTDLIIMDFDPSIGNYGVREFPIDPSKILGKCMDEILKRAPRFSP